MFGVCPLVQVLPFDGSIGKTESGEPLETALKLIGTQPVPSTAREVTVVQVPVPGATVPEVQFHTALQVVVETSASHWLMALFSVDISWMRWESRAWAKICPGLRTNTTAAARIPMMAMTIRSSIKVNPLLLGIVEYFLTFDSRPLSCRYFTATPIIMPRLKCG